MNRQHTFVWRVDCRQTIRLDRDYRDRQQAGRPLPVLFRVRWNPI